MSLELLLRQTAKVGGRELRLIPGRRLVIATSSGEREVQSPEQTNEMIQSLLAPILTPPIRQTLSTGLAEWTIRLPDLGAIRVMAETKGLGIHATLTFLEGNEDLVNTDALKVTPITTGAPMPKYAGVSSGATGEIEALFVQMYEMKGSDLHISVGSPPMIRLDGSIKQLPGFKALTPLDTERMIMPITPDRNREEFKRKHDADFAYSVPGVARFRCNIFRDRRGIGGVFRLIPSKIVSAEEMDLQKEILELCHLTKGLVLVTGPTGCGKSTTLAALIDYVNRNRTDHIVTIEDPIEFIHENKKCLINQRQVGEHTESFKNALRAALREDPDIVLVGELRDLETMAIAIETAETGHLVFGTLHTSSAASTIDRIIDQFPADRQEQIRVMLSESLKGVISQVLCKKIGGGRVAALEIMICIPSIANMIREAKIFQIPSIMQTQKKQGMVTMNDSLFDLVKRKLVEPQDAYVKATDKTGLLSQFRRSNIDTSWAPAETAAAAAERQAVQSA